MARRREAPNQEVSAGLERVQQEMPRRQEGLQVHEARSARHPGLALEQEVQETRSARQPGMALVEELPEARSEAPEVLEGAAEAACACQPGAELQEEGLEVPRLLRAPLAPEALPLSQEVRQNALRAGVEARIGRGTRRGSRPKEHSVHPSRAPTEALSRPDGAFWKPEGPAESMTAESHGGRCGVRVRH